MKLLAVFIVLVIGLYSSSVFTLTEQDFLTIAQNQFLLKVPQEIRGEFPDVSIDSAPPSYFYIWNREINDIPVIGDRFSVIISSDGSFVNDGLLQYSYSASEFPATAQLSRDQAKWLIEKNYGGSGEPELVYRGRRLIYQTQLTNGVTLGIDADTGESQILAVPLGTGGTKTVDTRFNLTTYYFDRYGSTIGLGALVLFGGMVYYRTLNKQKPTPRKRRS